MNIFLNIFHINKFTDVAEKLAQGLSDGSVIIEHNLFPKRSVESYINKILRDPEQALLESEMEDPSGNQKITVLTLMKLCASQLLGDQYIQLPYNQINAQLANHLKNRGLIDDYEDEIKGENKTLTIKFKYVSEKPAFLLVKNNQPRMIKKGPIDPSVILEFERIQKSLKTVTTSESEIIESNIKVQFES